MVRFMIPKTMMKKRRFKVSQEVVEVVAVSGASYTCRAADGSEKTFSRWRLFPERSGRLQQLPTFNGLDREGRGETQPQKEKKQKEKQKWARDERKHMHTCTREVTHDRKAHKKSAFRTQKKFHVVGSFVGFV
jgi:hypothetical protein